MQISDNVT